MIERTEEEIMQNWKGDLSVPFVSVCTITYNHEKYIAEALDSFLMQETSFPFEIVVDDDCSPDRTVKIIEQYIKKYPNIINAKLRKKNVGAITNYVENIKRARGKYVALCEGDDYWIDARKLQMQVVFLENNKKYSYCFHDFNTFHQDTQIVVSNTSLYYNHYERDIYFSPKSIILGPFVASTLTIMFRNIIEFPDCLKKLPFGDKSLEKLLAFYGHGYFINKSMACYRNHGESITKNNEWKKSMNNTYKIEYELFSCLKNTFPHKYIQSMECRIKYSKMMLYRDKRTFNFFYKISIIRTYSKMRIESFSHQKIFLLLLFIRLYFEDTKLLNIFERIYLCGYSFFNKKKLKNKELLK